MENLLMDVFISEVIYSFFKHSLMSYSLVMKIIALTLIVISSFTKVYCQAKGNINEFRRAQQSIPAQQNAIYPSTSESTYFSPSSDAEIDNYQDPSNLPNESINVRITPGNDIYLSVKGLFNVKADQYVAIFSVSQLGKTPEEVNELIDKRIQTIEEFVAQQSQVQMFLDMITFVPVYEFEEEKKIFSKSTYNEIPIGFEIKKNLHVQYSNPDFLNSLITECAKSEIYDLVRVDYISDNLAAHKNELALKVKELLEEKLDHYADKQGFHADSVEKKIGEGFKIIYPVEQYQSYQAYDQASFNPQHGKVHRINKSATVYYQPVFDKEFDVVINPVIVEPVIQILYERRMRIRKRDEQPTQRPTYMMISPAGELKELKLK